jgi:hypothetical protein
MPSVAEWRHWIDTVGIPNAQAYFQQHPIDEATLDWAHLVQDYPRAKELLVAHNLGQQLLPPGKLQQVTIIVTEYEANPPTKEEIEYLIGLLTRGGSNNTSIETVWKWHKYIVDIDSQKTNKDKEEELADKDVKGCFKQGFPVVVMDNGHDWGNEERLPKFWIVKLSLVPKETIYLYCEPETTGVGEDIETVRCREWTIHMAVLTPEMLNALNEDGEITLGLTEFENIMIRVRDL